MTASQHLLEDRFFPVFCRDTHKPIRAVIRNSVVSIPNFLHIYLSGICAEATNAIISILNDITLFFII
jgi:hypothetical protein